MLNGDRQKQLRQLVLVSLCLFLLSCLFPISASVLPVGRLPMWMGWLDGILAFAVTALALVVFSIAQRQVNDAAKQASFDAYRILANVPIVLLVAFFLFGQRIDWNILLPGLAWRFWLFSYVLPAMVAVLRAR